tara:strand:+ start:861 stop:1067 length:207 start_codon:yes stop_codon:yes gene_type:complete
VVYASIGYFVIYTREFSIGRSYNAKLTGTFYGERFCEKMKRSGMHKNERSKMFPRAAFCYAFTDYPES